MTQVTADLEYFKCDMCGIYMHKDLFCDHRRDCKGLHSQELRRSECRALQSELSEDTRRRIAQRDALVPTEAAGSVLPLLAVDAADKRREGRVRRQVVEEYEAHCDEAFEQKYSEERMKELMDFLNED